MGWRDNMQPGSFRGAPFLSTTSELTFGRNAEVHEFPLGEQPIPEDLGRKVRAWTLECFVWGDGYMAQRDTLIAAFEKPGPGTLIHPWQGVKYVQVREARCRETKADGGMAIFSVTVVEQSATTAPAPAADTQAASLSACDDADAQGQASLQDRLDVAGTPAFVQQGAVGVLGLMSSALSVLIGSAGCAGDGLWALQASAAAVGSQALALLATPTALAVQVQGVIGQVVDLATYPEDALSSLQTLIGFGTGLATPATTTTSGQIEASNQAALIQVVQAAAAAGAVRVSAEIDYDSYDQAAATRQQLADLVDDVAIAAAVSGDNALWQALDALRLAMSADLTARGASLQRLYAYTPAQTEPALVIAYRLYGDAGQADALVARNAIFNPLFVPGGQPIQVLTDDD